VEDWRFNSWGGKYPPWDLDDAVPARIAEALGLPLRRLDLVLEGGSIDVNGLGTLLTTESCLLNPNRNPALSRREIERALAKHLGAENVLWLREGIAGDDTDGHVDDLARFVAPSTVVAAIEHDRADPNYEPLRANLEALERMRDQDGRPLEIVPLPMPRPLYFGGHRLPASYANFYIGNAAVLVPVFGDPMDDVACATLARLFPDRRIVPIPCADLVWGLGAVHCVTQQQPARASELDSPRGRDSAAR
jgi:agmatine deiminase